MTSVGFFFATFKISEIDLQSGFKLRDMTHVKDYLPDRKLKPKLNLWLSQAFQHGDTRHGVFVFCKQNLDGEGKQFPFLLFLQAKEVATALHK